MAWYFPPYYTFIWGCLQEKCYYSVVLLCCNCEMSRDKLLGRTQLLQSLSHWSQVLPTKELGKSLVWKTHIIRQNTCFLFICLLIHLFVFRIDLSSPGLATTHFAYKLVSNLQQSSCLCQLGTAIIGVNHCVHLLLMFCKHWEGNSTEASGHWECLYYLS